MIDSFTYCSRTVGTPAQIVQTGVPFLVEYRDVEIGTETIDCSDKEVQFGFGDETDLLNIIACVKARRARGGSNADRSDTKDSDDNNRKGQKKAKSRGAPSLLEEAGVGRKDTFVAAEDKAGVESVSDQS